MKHRARKKPKNNTTRNVVMGMLVLLLLWGNFSLASQFSKNTDPRIPYQSQINSLKYDRVRLEDATNLLLALQDFNFEMGTFPNDLNQLKEEGYLDEDKKLIDPETSQSYFYKKIDDSFVLCIKLSDALKGVNKNECPVSFSANFDGEATSAQASSLELDVAPTPLEVP